MYKKNMENSGWREPSVTNIIMPNVKMYMETINRILIILNRHEK